MSFPAYKYRISSGETTTKKDDVLLAPMIADSETKKF